MCIIKEYLQSFKDITIKLIYNVKEDDLDAVDSLMEERQKIIDNIDHMEFSKEEFVDIAKELNIIEYDKELEKVINEKKANIKEEMRKLSTNRNANVNYNKKFYSNSTIFSKKI
ncbi:flagellar protein FliT [Clostridium lundense]|uniref:flagellar protein FliT n=1 Tax=Clostridium lundense TaxID=319475 RepID=UPI000484EE79|nr:flagellar protein FliT [Clostridium lundense]